MNTRTLTHTHNQGSGTLAHPLRTLDRLMRRQLQLHPPLEKNCLTFASSPTCCLQHRRACSLGGLFSLRKCPRPRLASHSLSLPPTLAFHFTVLPTQLHYSSHLPPTSVSSSSSSPSLHPFTLLPRTTPDPRTTTATHRHTLHNPHTMDLLSSHYPQEPSCARMPAL